MKKFLTVILLVFCSVLMSACTNDNQKLIGMPNPWTDCNQNLAQAAKIAGFKFPLEIRNSNIRAMKDMIEITYPLNGNREVTIRKSYENGRPMDEHGLVDISGDYNTYPVNKDIELFDSVWANIRGTEDKINVVNFSAESGVYSISCAEGLTLDEVCAIFKIIEQVEAPKNIP